ncbi:ribose ABC transporter ATP-binding protein [Spiroplasma helicoides]|uniref:Ribose ABC transporter ATP-binding protein n=1 Tax=Spiroplasma helicoides TaxID=216938 RepID=A0A1B3SLU9_9MOLU|nr:sugar ABC transporter ATP-binding protein [Spiroplasma helicoides]AOG60908.1 ribose ABC transporter ATP-binding protein [Spiroplasma helicoides]
MKNKEVLINKNLQCGPILKLENIKKNFGKVKALKGVNLNIFKGKVMGILGENGAGKSTLMNILSGVYQMSSGHIYNSKNESITFNNIKEAEKYGVCIIHQEILSFPDMTVIDNVFIGHEKSKLGFVSYKKQKKLLLQTLEEMSLNIPINKLMKDLTIAEQQMVEIAKALIKKSKIIIMDEPTSSLSQKETKVLFKIIEKLKKEDCAILYISHRLEEIPIICDLITIIRDGEFIGEYKVGELSENDLIAKMVGREIEDKFPKKTTCINEKVIFSVKNITSSFLKNISFNLYEGEILGFAGLVGSKRTELFKSLIGLLDKGSGEVLLNDKKISFKSPSDAIKQGFYYVTEDRKSEGLILDESIKTNISLSSLKNLSVFGFVKPSQETQKAKDFIKYFSIKTPSYNQKVSAMSGGNQQKVLLAKAFCSKPKVLIFDEPTRGVDVGSRKEIYDLIYEAKNNGIGVIVISSDLAEVIGLCNRVAVMKDGRIAKIISEDITQENVIKYAL